MAIVWLNYHHLFRFFLHVTPRLVWINFLHLLMVLLIPFATAWVARTKLAAAPVFAYAVVFVIVNLAYIPFEWQLLRQTSYSQRGHDDSPKARSFVRFGTFTVAMLVSLKFPSLGFGLICCALLLYLCPELLRIGRGDAGEVRCEQENIAR